jgi:hypothetical protein
MDLNGKNIYMYMYLYMNIDLDEHRYIYRYKYIYIYIYMYIYILKYKHVHIYIYMYIQVVNKQQLLFGDKDLGVDNATLESYGKYLSLYVYIYMGVDVCMDVCIFVFVFIYTDIYEYIYVYIWTLTVVDKLQFLSLCIGVFKDGGVPVIRLYSLVNMLTHQGRFINLQRYVWSNGALKVGRLSCLSIHFLLTLFLAMNYSQFLTCFMFLFTLDSLPQTLILTPTLTTILNLTLILLQMHRSYPP